MDAVVNVLNRRGDEHLRLDLDLLPNDAVILDPLMPLLRHQLPGSRPREVTNPSAVLYRAPTHLRESSGHRYSPDDLLRRHQWAAFARSLMVFREAKWINHPAKTYMAENKPLQLVIAASVGLSVPVTRIANRLPVELADEPALAVKALDSFLVRQGDEDLFFYTARLEPPDLTVDACREMPIIIQEFYEPKVDVRITVVGDACFVAETGRMLPGDWRQQKQHASFRRADAPKDLLDCCRALVRALGLVYGAIDLVRQDESYHFLEVNPTGEWAWIDELFEGEVARAFAAELAGQ